MKTNDLFIKSLCLYQDEMIGANPVPLTIRGKNVLIKKSSEYFAKSSLNIDLQLNRFEEIQKIQLGAEISIDLQTMKSGLDFGPFGLFPVHVVQLDKSFDPQIGGILRFGFLKKIFVLKALTFTFLRLLSKIGLYTPQSFHKEIDLSTVYQNHFGQKHWGIFDVLVKRDTKGQWVLSQVSPDKQERIVDKLIARFKVNKWGMVLGIKDMISL